MRQATRKLLKFILAEKHRWLFFIATLIVIGIYTAYGPPEFSLGTHVRIVYLHGAWVWTALTAFAGAAICGGLGLATQRGRLHFWSLALGRTGLFFWISYLPLSLLAMQSNWNGLFLAEPRWRVALAFSVAGILAQVGLSLLKKPSVTSAFNIIYLMLLAIGLGQAPNMLHPTSPIVNSNAWRIQSYFFGLVLLSLLAAGQMARWWYLGEQNGSQH